MPVTYSPLRYPGGKTKLYDEIKPLLWSIGDDLSYIEPFAGGAGLALKLLFSNDVESIILNDIDKNICCFWISCLEQTNNMCDLIENAVLTIDEWYKQKNILENGFFYSNLERAFALLYLNRCNRSGIIKGGPIGGKEQTGKYKIDARFNKKVLINKIQAIGAKNKNISVYCMDARQFLTNICFSFPINKTVINIDPPYVNKGPELYQNSFTEKDHQELSYVIRSLKQHWIVTYDVCDFIKSLYNGFSIKNIKLGYSAGEKRKVGEEYLITNISYQEV